MKSNIAERLKREMEGKTKSRTINNLSNSCRHLANADVIANVKSIIIVSRWRFFADMIFSATSKVQNHQNKTGEKSLYPSKYVLTAYFKEFKRYFPIYMLYSLS